MMIEDDLVARLRERDSSVYMNGDENWVLTVHPDNPTCPGTLMVNLPWQACRLLREAADEIERLRAEGNRLCDAVREVERGLHRGDTLTALSEACDRWEER